MIAPASNESNRQTMQRLDERRLANHFTAVSKAQLTISVGSPGEKVPT